MGMPIFRHTAVSSQAEPAQGAHALASLDPTALWAADSIELATHLAELAKAGLPLAGGLRALADELPRGRLARTCRALADKLDSGVPLEQAIGSRDMRLPAHMRALLVAGVRSGRLVEVLEQYLDHQRL